jgi:hypothetical protein
MLDPSTPATPARHPALVRLRRLNLAAALAHLASALAVAALANDFALPVTSRYLTGPPGGDQTIGVTVAELPVAWFVALFFALSALAHALAAGPLRARYEHWLASGWNPLRWVEYSLSASVMLVVILQLCGITDAAALITAVGANVAMMLFGWLQERYERPGGAMTAFWFGCLAGAAPWLAVVWYTLSPLGPPEATPPGFVYGIVVSLFVFFNCFGLNQWLQYRQVGPWREYLHGERTYLVLSLAAKSALAWQVFAGTLAG